MKKEYFINFFERCSLKVISCLKRDKNLEELNLRVEMAFTVIP
jgi:hypothetical protein